MSSKVVKVRKVILYIHSNTKYTNCQEHSLHIAKFRCALPANKKSLEKC